MTDQNRTAEILAGVDAVILAHDEWAGDVHSGDIPPDSFDHTVMTLARVLTEAEIPAELSALVAAAVKFADNWDRYLSRERNFVIPGQNKRPTAYAFGGFNEMHTIRSRYTAPETIETESVSILMDQGVTPGQIAKIFGSRDPETDVYSGPFFAGGKACVELVLAQHQFEQGEGGRQVLPDGYNRVTIDRRPGPADDDALSQRLVALKGRLEKNAPPPAPPADGGTPESLVLEGAYPHQVQKAFNLTDDELARVYLRVDAIKSGRPTESVTT